ncbi:MAG: transposase [Anaerolineaceae bacterium]|nr:transposase [Anaerolineaceae bacterium]
MSTIRVRRDFKGMEQRRCRAARLFATGKLSQAAIARALGVTRQSVSRWYHEWERGGALALRGAGRAGRRPRLDHEQLRRVERALRQGAPAHGFETDLWTLPRIAAVIESVTGVRYHPGHVWRILGALGWTLQRPSKRARERNEEAVQDWVAKRWPAVKKTPAGAGPGSSSRTKAGSRSSRRSGAPGRPGGKHRS